MSTINQRIAQIIVAFGDTESGFAKRIEVSSSVMFNIVNRKGRMSYPSGPVLEKILDLEIDGMQISAEWLMRGVGEIKTSKTEISSSEAALDYLRDTIAKLKGETGS